MDKVYKIFYKDTYNGKVYLSLKGAKKTVHNLTKYTKDYDNYCIVEYKLEATDTVVYDGKEWRTEDE